MSLRDLANGATSKINANVIGTLYTSAGYTTAPSGDRFPMFGQTPRVAMQVQALTGKELTRLDGLNIQGILRGVYLDGRVDGVRRLTNQGGDMLFFGGSYWLVTQVLEPWDGKWIKVAVTEQIEPVLYLAGVVVTEQSAAVVMFPGA